MTGERIGYFAAPKAGYPKVGVLYRGGAEVFNYGSPRRALKIDNPSCMYLRASLTEGGIRKVELVRV